MKAFAQETDFPVTLIFASLQAGKSRIDNEAVAAACGNVRNDVDEWFSCHTID